MLSPSFQRGSVWTTPAKAYLIDTIMRGYPIPPIHVRHVTSAEGRLVREVVDGQQRLTAVIDYIDGKFPLARPRQSPDPLPPWAGKRFADLDLEFRRRVREYSFRCEVYKGNIDDSVIYEVFARINIHSVQLSAQELRNGRYFGEFKQAVYRLSDEHKALWKSLALFSSQNLARMLDAQFVSEALIVQIEGMQDKKNSIDDYYRRYDQDWEDRRFHESLFRETIDIIRGTFGDLVATTKFKRVPLFYSLYCVVVHHISGIPAQTIPLGGEPLPASPRRRLEDTEKGRLQTTLAMLAGALENDDSADEDVDVDNSGDAADDEAAETPALVRMFIRGSSGQTDNIRPRLERFNAIWQLADL